MTSLPLASFIQIPVTATKPGTFKVAHNLGRMPKSGDIRMTSPGAIWWQSPVDMDSTNVYLVASDAGVSAKIQLS